jgi:transcriptional regulator GlxA family with amidase domain
MMQYADELRIAAAASCLDHGHGPIIDIVYATGFTTIQQFYVSFRRVFRTTPGEYATNHLRLL